MIKQGLPKSNLTFEALVLRLFRYLHTGEGFFLCIKHSVLIDPCAVSGAMLLEVKNELSGHKVGHFYSQELNGTTYNLNRMNMLLHGVPYKQFTAYNYDTLKNDNFYEDGQPILFDIQVSNPPYSAANSASDPSYLNDVRYSACGALAPKTKADLQFVEHMVYHMADDGRIAVLLPHGVLFWGGAEETIQKYLVDTLNVLDAVIGIPAGLFHGTGIPVACLIFKKKRNGNSGNILFIDASREFVKDKKVNLLSEENYVIFLNNVFCIPAYFAYRSP